MNLKILPIFSILLLLLVPNIIHAEQFIPYTGITWNHRPDVCVLDNTLGHKAVNYTQAMVNVWVDALDKVTHSSNWDMKVRLADRMEITHCDIVFNYDLETHDWNYIGKGKGAQELGVTQCDPETNYCTIKIHTLNLYELDLTVQHEFGHALGLGHRQGDTRADAMAAFLSDDLMFAYAKKFQHLTMDDVLALVDLYGHNGWSNIPAPTHEYIIHHPTHIKTYCNGVNATGGICDHAFVPAVDNK